MSSKATAALVAALNGAVLVQQTAGKGWPGQAAESHARRHRLTRGLAWAGVNSPLPDCAGVDIKVVPVRLGRDGRYHAEEDLQIHMVSAKEMEAGDMRPVLAKLDMVMCFYVRPTPTSIRIIAAVHQDWSRDAVVRTDIQRAFDTFAAGRARGRSAKRVIDGMGSKTGGYGQVIRTKTKGKGRLAPGECRTRAFYIGRRAADESVPADCRSPASAPPAPSRQNPRHPTASPVNAA